MITRSVVFIFIFLCSYKVISKTVREMSQLKRSASSSFSFRQKEPKRSKMVETEEGEIVDVGTDEVQVKQEPVPEVSESVPVAGPAAAEPVPAVAVPAVGEPFKKVRGDTPALKAWRAYYNTWHGRHGEKFVGKKITEKVKLAGIAYRHENKKKKSTDPETPEFV